MAIETNLNSALNHEVANAARAKVVIGGEVCIGELLMWDSKPVCFLFDNELGERAVMGFPEMRSFVGWLEKRLGAGHNIRIA
jgi:hypothetical protein